METAMTSKVKQLSTLDRAALIEELLRSFDTDAEMTAEIQAAWVAETHDRIEAYHKGEIPARDIDELFEEIDRKFST